MADMLLAAALLLDCSDAPSTNVMLLLCYMPLTLLLRLNAAGEQYMHALLSTVVSGVGSAGCAILNNRVHQKQTKSQDNEC
jgi:hypothetical protein